MDNNKECENLLKVLSGTMKECVPKWAIYARQKYKLLCIADLLEQKDSIFNKIV